MKFPMRIFGEIRGIAKDEADFIKGKNLYPFYFDDNVISIEYEGPFIDIEPVLDDILALPGQAYGHIDCIDHDNWEVTRYSIENGTWTAKRINPDNVLEAMKW